MSSCPVNQRWCLGSSGRGSLSQSLRHPEHPPVPSPLSRLCLKSICTLAKHHFSRTLTTLSCTAEASSQLCVSLASQTMKFSCLGDGTATHTNSILRLTIPELSAVYPSPLGASAVRPLQASGSPWLPLLGLSLPPLRDRLENYRHQILIWPAISSLAHIRHLSPDGSQPSGLLIL